MKCVPLAVVAAATVVLAGCAKSAETAPSHADRLEHLALPALTGRTMRVADFAGRVRVVNLWATWCPPCIAELPMLERVSRGGKAVLLGLDQGEDRKPVLAAAAKAHITYPVLLDADQAFGAQYATVGLPTTLILARDGHVSTLHQGEYDEAELRADILRAAQ